MRDRQAAAVKGNRVDKETDHTAGHRTKEMTQLRFMSGRNQVDRGKIMAIPLGITAEQRET